MMDSLLLYKILKNRTGAEISASGNPAIMSDTLKNNPMNEMKVYGWSKQEATKGKNLFDFSRLVSDGVNTMDYDNQTITVPAYTNNTGYNQTLRDLCPGITPGTYVFSMKRSNPESGNGSYFLETAKDFPTNTPIELTDELLNNHIAWYNNPDSEVENVISEIQIEIGTEATDYEPYTGGQPSPSPDYPQEIVSAGSDGKIGIEVRGKNLVDIYGYSASGMFSPEAERNLFNDYGTTISTTEKTDKLIVNQEIIDGATADNYTSGYFCVGINPKLEDGKNYIITFKINVIQNPFHVSDIIVMFNGIDAYRAQVVGDKVTVKAKYNESNERQYVEFRIRGMSLEFSNFMIVEVGETDDYEPYYEPQSLSISTLTRLSAIPVNTGGNYTDDDGQQWIADYIDFKRGKLVKIVNSLILDGDKLKFVADPTNTYWNLPQQSAVKPIGYDVLSNYFKIKVFFSNEYSNFIYTIQKNMVGLFETVDELNAFVVKKYRENDAVVLYYRMQEPIETDLAPEEIQAYKNLVTYAETTIVENDADCYVEVSAGGGDTLRAKKLALILGE